MPIPYHIVRYTQLEVPIAKTFQDITQPEREREPLDPIPPLGQPCSCSQDKLSTPIKLPSSLLIPKAGANVEVDESKAHTRFLGDTTPLSGGITRSLSNSPSPPQPAPTHQEDEYPIPLGSPALITSSNGNDSDSDSLNGNNAECPSEVSSGDRSRSPLSIAAIDSFSIDDEDVLPWPIGSGYAIGNNELTTDFGMERTPSPMNPGSLLYTRRFQLMLAHRLDNEALRYRASSRFGRIRTRRAPIRCHLREVARRRLQRRVRRRRRMAAE